MTTIEEIRSELNDAKDRLDKAEKRLEDWEEGKKQERLDELERKLDEGEWRNDDQKERWEESVKKLEKEKERLENNVDDWKEQVAKLQNKLTDFGGGEESGYLKTQYKRKREVDDTWSLAEEEAVKIKKIPSPSDFCKEEYDPDYIFNFCPNYVNISVVLYHPVFGRFKDQSLERQDVKPADIENIVNLLNDMAKTYLNEAERLSVFQEQMGKLLGYPMKKFSINNCTSDGAVTFNVQSKQYALLILEAKNNLGAAGDAYFQVAGSYGKYLGTIHDYERYCNPCFLLHLHGSWLGISGAVFGKKIIVEPLTHMIPLLPIYNQPEHLSTIISVIKALKNGLDELKDHYKSVVPDSIEIPRQSYFPYPNVFTNNDGDMIKFIYLKELYEKKNLFLIQDEKAKKYVVKFVYNNYGADAHKYCQNLKIAPELIAIENIKGNWKMIVIEYLSPDIYTDLYSYLQCQTSDQYLLKKKAMDITELLHNGGFVHGDLRPSNIMVSLSEMEDKVLKFIDFDWSGKACNTKYPLTINTKIPWHPEVHAGADIKKEHDIYLLEKSFGPSGPL